MQLSSEDAYHERICKLTNEPRFIKELQHKSQLTQQQIDIVLNNHPTPDSQQTPTNSLIQEQEITVNNQQQLKSIQDQINDEIKQNRIYEWNLHQEINKMNSQLKHLEEMTKNIDQTNSYLMRVFKDINLFELLTTENAYLKNEVKDLCDSVIVIKSQNLGSYLQS